MWQALRITFLFIGTSIGAGFSSGREIALFFNDLSPINVALSALFMSLVCALFLIVGKLDLLPKSKIVKLGIFLSAAISLCSMLAGGELVLKSLTGAPLLGLIMSIVGAVVVIFGIEKIKLANCILVPLIIISIAVIYFKVETPIHSNDFSIMKPIMYSGLDVLLGGVIIAYQGKKLSYKQIFASCIFTTIFIGLILFMLQTVVLTDTAKSAMPVLAVAENVGLKVACGTLIASAIFTTLVSSLHICTEMTQEYMLSKPKLKKYGSSYYHEFLVFSLLLIGYPISCLGFENIVDYGYPFVSFCGIFLTVIVLIKLIVYIYKYIKYKKSGTDKELIHQKICLNQQAFNLKWIKNFYANLKNKNAKKKRNKKKLIKT